MLRISLQWNLSLSMGKKCVSNWLLKVDGLMRETMLSATDMNVGLCFLDTLSVVTPDMPKSLLKFGSLWSILEISIFTIFTLGRFAL